MSESSSSFKRKKCNVCGDISSSEKFGIFTCKPCRLFIWRTINGKKRYTCSGSGECSVVIPTRSKCSYCRFKKCTILWMASMINRINNATGKVGTRELKWRVQVKVMQKLLFKMKVRKLKDESDSRRITTDNTGWGEKKLEDKVQVVEIERSEEAGYGEWIENEESKEAGGDGEWIENEEAGGDGEWTENEESKEAGGDGEWIENEEAGGDGEWTENEESEEAGSDDEWIESEEVGGDGEWTENEESEEAGGDDESIESEESEEAGGDDEWTESEESEEAGGDGEWIESEESDVERCELEGYVREVDDDEDEIFMCNVHVPDWPPIPRAAGTQNRTPEEPDDIPLNVDNVMLEPMVLSDSYTPDILLPILQEGFLATVDSWLVRPLDQSP